MKEVNEHRTPDKAARFVHDIIKRCQQDKGLAARLRRADNPATEYQSWDVLAAYGIDLEKEYERLPYVTVAAAIARSKAGNNGSLPLGKAIAACFDDASNSDQAQARLRRLLACDDAAEACRILRPLFSLIDSRVPQALDFARLLKQLLWFNERTRASWAQEFYGRSTGEQQGCRQEAA